MRGKNIWYLLIFALLLIAFFALYQSGLVQSNVIVFSKRDMLLSLWDNYKKNYIDPSSFRTIDRQRENVTTSEGQSYTLLRAVWADDKETFDRSLAWTEANLRRSDGLFSWLYGKLPNGEYGIITEQGGENSATDAETDIALALIFAHARWNDTKYLSRAREIVDAVWEEAVIEINSTPYLTANNIEKNSPSDLAVINPSYFSPYAYRIFAKINPENPWLELVDSSYDVLSRTISSPLDKATSAGLPPDWILINKISGEISAPQETSELTTNYSYDALRIPWRIALDHLWFDEPRAKSTLNKMIFLQNEWREKKTIYGQYSHNGIALSKEEPVAMYGGSIGYFVVIAPKLARQIYNTKLRANFDPDSGGWKNKLSYYDDNWAWFGIALYADLLPDLAATIPDEEFTTSAKDQE